MKLKQCVAIAAIGLFSMECGTDSLEKSLCEQEGGLEYVDQIGRIYKSNGPDAFFFIGPPDPPSIGAPGGFIPCKDMRAEFRVEGVKVKFSGKGRGSIPDTGDPLYAFITLARIEKIP